MSLPIVVHTRLNLRRAAGGKWPGIPSPEWTKRRIETYLEWTLPSIMRQTVRVVPLLRCAGGEFREETEWAIGRLRNAGVIVAHDEEWHRTIQQCVGEQCYLVNLDSDDAYGPSALEQVHLLGERHGLFNRGYQYWVSTGKIRPCVNFSPAFWVLCSHWNKSKEKWMPKHVSHSTFRRRFKPVLLRGPFVEITHANRHTGKFHNSRRVLYGRKAWIGGERRSKSIRELGLND